MEKKKKMPELDELVIATVTKVFPYGAFCKIEDYEIDAFLHVSEVSSGWVKNIRNFLKEGQKLVVRVYRVIPEKNMVDISLKRVTEAERKRKLEEIKRDKRVTKLLEVAKSKIKQTDLKIDEVKAILNSNFDDAFSAFEEIINGNEDSLKKTKLPKEWIDAIIETAKENIKKQVRIVKGIITLKCTREDGVDVLKELLKVKPNSGISIHYLGAPTYQVIVEGDDYKACEKKLKSLIENIEKQASKKECEFSFEKQEE